MRLGHPRVAVLEFGRRVGRGGGGGEEDALGVVDDGEEEDGVDGGAEVEGHVDGRGEWGRSHCVKAMATRTPDSYG